MKYRRIIIQLDPRVPGDNPEFLQNIADAFPQEDIYINVDSKNKDNSGPIEPIERDRELEAVVIDEASVELEERHSRVEKSKSNFRNVTLHKKNKLKEFLEKIGMEGIKALAYTVAKLGLENWFK